MPVFRQNIQRGRSTTVQRPAPIYNVQAIQQRPNIQQLIAQQQPEMDRLKREADYANSFRGLATNTAKADGSTALNFGKEVARIPLTVPLKVVQSLAEAATKKPQVYTPQTGIEKFFYGDQPRQSYQQDQQGIQQWGQEKGLGRGSSIALGAAGAGAEILADLLPAGAGEKVLNKLKAVRPFQKPILNVQKSVQTQALKTPIAEIRRTIQKDVPAATKEFSKVSSYTPSIAQAKTNVNPLIQEARKYKSANAFIENRTADNFQFYSTETPKNITIDWIESGTKGKGEGTQAMKDLFSYADAKGKTIEVFPENLTSGKPYSIEQKQKLIDWYESLGFKKSSKSTPEGRMLWERTSQPLQEGVKQRGFVGTMKKSAYTSSQTKKLLTDANYTPQGNDDLIKEANRQIKTDIGAAKTKALLGDDNQSVANAMELIKHYQNVGDHDQAAAIAKTVAEKLTAHGQAVQAAAIYNKLTPEGIVRFAQKEAGKEGIVLNGEQTKELYELAVKANSATGDSKAILTNKMLSRVQEFIPSKFIDQATTVWKAGLLSSPTTHLRNIVGTGGMTTLETVKDIPATALDKIASLFTGKRTKTLPNLPSMWEGVRAGAKKSLTFAKTGVDLDNTLGKIDYKQVNLPPVLKQYTQTIFRGLGSEDKIFKEVLLKKSLHEMAVVDGINMGLKGEKLAEHAINLYKNPTVEMVKAATEEAAKGTFNNPNALSNMINQGKRNVSPAVRGLTEFFVPFSRTPANVGARIIDYSPLGFAKAGYHASNNAGQKTVVEDLARAITGSGVMAGGYALGKSGMMTGNYPTDPTQRAMWDAQGLQPNALKLGGKTYSMNALSPVGNLLGLGSGVQQLKGRVKPEAYPAAIGALGGQTMVNQTFLQGVSGALNALTDPGANAATWANSAAAGVIPSIVGSASRAIDPTMRQSNGMADAMQAKIPGLTQDLLPKVDVLGQNRTYNDGSLMGRLGQFYNPFTPRDIKQNPVIDEINRLEQAGSQVSASLPGKQVSVAGFKVNLTPEEYTRLEQESGGNINSVLQKIISQQEYQQASDYDKANIINKIIQVIRQNWNTQNIGGLTNSKDQIMQQVQKKQTLNSFYTK